MLGLSSLACVLVLALGAVAYPYPVAVTQPVYQQVYQQQVQVPQLQYRQPVYLGQAPQAHPVFEQAEQQQPQYVAQAAQPLAQPLLGTVDRQIQKAATHLAGPSYAQQIQQLQLQGQQQQAQAQVQRNALRVSTAPRAQPLQYQRALQAQQAEKEEEQQEDYNSNPSYQFGFDVKDDLYTNYQNRKEQREGDKITGSYSVVDSDGFIRTVTYTADPKEGFKAEVTRQPTDIVVKVPPQPQYQHQQQQQQQQQQPEPQYVRQQPEPQYLRQQPQYAEVPSQQAGPDQGKQQRIIYQYQ